MKEIQPTLIIGLGGTGTLAVSEIKRLAKELYLDPRHDFPLLRFLAIDTEFVTAPTPSKLQKKYGADPDSKIDASYEETFEISLETTERLEIKANPENLRRWLQRPEELQAEDFVSPEYMGEVAEAVKGTGAGGFGIVGKLSLWQHLDTVIAAIRNQLAQLNNDDEIDRQLQEGYPNVYRRDRTSNAFNIFVLCSVGGGTGKGTCLPVGVIVREILEVMDPTKQILSGSERYLVNFMPSCFEVSGRSIGPQYLTSIHANQYASYKELEHVMLHGYPVEQKLKTLLGLTRDTSERPYSNVLNVSAQKDPSGSYVGDYATINKAVAETILAYTFGGLVGPIRAYFTSNKGNFIAANPIRENASDALRSRDYGRIGRYKLTLPVDQLFRYAEAFHTKEIFEDMLIGHLSGIPDANRVRPSDAADFISAFVTDSEQLLKSPAPVSFDSLSTAMHSFDDPWVTRITEAISGRLAALQSEFVKSNKGEQPHEEKVERLVSSHLSGDPARSRPGITKQLQAYICDAGMENAASSISYAVEKMENHISATMKDAVLAATRNARFSFADHTADLSRHLHDRWVESEKQLKELAGGRGEAFKTARNDLAADKKTWKAENKGILKAISLVRETPRDIRAAATSLRALCEMATRAADDLFALSQQRAFLAAHRGMYDRLQEFQGYLSANRRVLKVVDEKQRLTGGLVAESSSRMADIYGEARDSLETRVLGNQEEDFRGFARDLRLRGATVSEYAQTKLNSAFMPRLVLEDIDADVFTTVVSAHVVEIQGLKSGHTVMKFLEGKRREEVRGILVTLERDASLLAPTDPSRIRGATTTGGYRTTIVQSQDSTYLRRFSDVLKADFVSFDSPEEVILTRFETALPLFAFAELYTSQRRYRELVKAKGRTAEMQRHTHTALIQTSEPIGATAVLSEGDAAVLLNFLQHLGVLRVDPQGFVLHNTAGVGQRDKFEIFHDTRRQGRGRTSQELRVHVSEFVSHLSEQADWFTHFAELARKKLRSLFAMTSDAARKKAIAAVERYLVREELTKGYPYMPPALLTHMRNRQDDDTHPQQALVRLLSEREETNSLKAEYTRQHEPAKLKACVTEQQIGRLFDLWPRSYTPARAATAAKDTEAVAGSVEKGVARKKPPSRTAATAKKSSGSVTSRRKKV